MTRIPLRSDYDEDPERFLGGPRAVGQYWIVKDVHEDVADRMLAEHTAPVLDVGCGTGRLVNLLAERDVEFVGLDRSPTMLEEVSGHTVLGDATDLPFPDGAFGGVAALYMLYHLADPSIAIAEAFRVLRPGGLFVASSPSPHDDPELKSVLPPEEPMTFDAESGPDLIEAVFQNVDVEPWDVPGVRLPDTDALERYLYHHNQIPPAQARELALDVQTPLTLTKRGALIWARKQA